ncbi:MAG TPA: glycosyltransferase family 4 protein [Candidatus Binatia bacterium]
MKILIVNSLYPPHVRGGAERHVQNLAESLAGRDIEVVVASTVEEGSARVDIVNAVKVVYLSIANLYWPFDRVVRSPGRRKLWHLVDAYNPAMKAELARLIGRERPSLLHTGNLQGISVAAWHAARAARLPVVHTLQDYYLTCGRCSRYRDGQNCARTCWDCLPFLMARRRASACVAGVVGVSRFILDHHRGLGLFANARFSAVVPHDSLPVPDSDAAEPRAATLTFGYLGRLVPEKGIDLLLDTFAAEKEGGWRLLIAGEGDAEYAGQLSRRVRPESRDSIRFLGWVDPGEFFSGIDVLIVPSRWQEPLPRVVLEAYSYGVPVIASRRGGIPEQVGDGRTGFLFDPDDPSALGEIVERVLKDRSLAGGLGQNALRHARENTSERMVHAYLDVYRAVLESAGSKPAGG